MSDNRVNVLLTGGAGFLGKAVIRELFEEDSPILPGIVRVLDIQDEIGPFHDRIEFIKGDVRDYELVEKACDGMDVVIHAAAIVDWGVRSDSEVLGVNVTGTENLIKACKSKGVRYFVHTSSLDAVYSGNPLVNIDEDFPYPEKHETTYCGSKYLSEVIVREANGNELQTVIVRPSDIYGEMDPYHIGSLIDMARGGFYIRLGNGSSKCQHIYVGNMAVAMLQAAHAMINGNKLIGGEIYFITDGTGSNFFTFFDQIVLGAGYKIWPKNLWLPRLFAYSLASISEFIAFLLRPIKKYHPKFSRFAVTYTCTDFTFTSDKAKRDFNFRSKYSKEQALERTVAFYQKERLNS